MFQWNPLALLYILLAGFQAFTIYNQFSVGKEVSSLHSEITALYDFDKISEETRLENEKRSSEIIKLSEKASGKNVLLSDDIAVSINGVYGIGKNNH